MLKDEVVGLFNQFKNNYDIEHYSQVWQKQSHTFRVFWQEKILGNRETNPQIDYDPIIKFIDINARGFNQHTDEAVARIGFPSDNWYRIFDNLKNQKVVRSILDSLFMTTNEAIRVNLVDQLKFANERNKNYLTGKNAAALNALLFLNNPDKQLSRVSTADREKIIHKFELPTSAPYASYGKKVIYSNREIMDGFKTVYGIDAWPRLLSNFFFSVEGEPLWKKEH